ncbi:serine/threonine-protein kinase [Nocardioides sp.]|uniref:serine/threonine-protein kinase n=1 Tax=Nocardioides sp. TaxID=35761 RepID=UPI002728EF3D|nr:serine/threonine-protein kinase [Nocardioides sp.]MDO9454990.1 serine/threonine-protein kinase [Nocardioides sp.]
MTSEVSGGSGSGSDGSDAAWRPPAPPAAPSEQLDGYTDLVEIGRGGDSVVYRARELALGREVAIKVLSLDTANDPARSARFAREIEITVQLGRQHPNIVTVLATGTTASGRPAVVMDFFEGGTLHDRLKAYGPLPAEEVGRIGEVLADALSFAHERGVLHRDVKPQNVLVLPTSWVLADFGIARLVDSEHTSSAETFTYRHAAPQILDGHAPTPADDVWSLGSTLFTLLDGRPPFASDDPDEDSALAYLRRARTEPHRPLDVPGAERLAPVIARCLSKDVAGRWSSAAELRDALHGLRASAWEPGTGSTSPAAPAPPTLAKAPVADPPSPVSPVAEPTPAPTPTQTYVAPISPSPISPSPLSHSPGGPRADEPVPVALSAVSPAVPTVDAAPTGTGLPDATGEVPGGRGTPEVADEEDAPRRRRLPLLLGAGALVIGLTLGILGAVLRDDDEPAAPGTAEPITGQGTVPDLPTDTVTGRPDPKLRVVLQDIRLDSRNLTASWTDPTDGEGQFYLYATTRDVPQGFQIAYSPQGTGQPEETFELNTPLPQGRACFYVIVKTATGAYGISDKTARCRDVTPFGLEMPTG